jgi:hypothetical protein
MRDDDPEISCSIFAFNPFDPGDRSPVDLDIQLDAFDEVYEQIWDCLNVAYQNREDRWQAVRLIIQAEKLVTEYIGYGWTLMQPLAEVLHRLFRAERRIFIRRALLCREEYRPIYKKALERWDCDADAADDFRVVVRHLDEGRALLDDLRRG